jgi:hypothetical protein
MAETLDKYRGKFLTQMPPHVFAIAEFAYAHPPPSVPGSCSVMGLSGATDARCIFRNGFAHRDAAGIGR